MTLPASGPISLTDIQTEFGGSAPISLQEYYGAAPGVPTSGLIGLHDFYGKSAGSAFQVTVAAGPVDVNFPNLRGCDLRTGSAGLPYGSFPSQSLPSPLTMFLCVQMNAAASTPPNDNTLEIWIAGFTSDPGQSKLTSATVNGVTKLGASVFLYQYFASGRARWVWSGQSNNWGFSVGNTYNGSLVLT